MNWKVNTITNRNNGKCEPEGELPIRLTLVEDALERSEPETEGVYIGRVERDIVSSFLVAVQTAPLGDGIRGRSSATGVRDYSVNLLPLHELIARVCVALKRNHASDEEKVLFSVGDLHLDASRYLVQKRGRPLHLTPKEFALLHKLMMNAGKPVSHRKLLRSVWGAQYGCEREYLRIFVRQLRLKIEDNPANPKYLLTEPNIGYRFAESVKRDSVIPSSE
jgi:two-component system, OmpR family, KDP operon response regulator KdpE